MFVQVVFDVCLEWSTFLRPLPVGAPRGLGLGGAMPASHEDEWEARNA